MLSIPFTSERKFPNCLTSYLQKLLSIINAKYASWLPRIHFSPHIAPEAIYFRSWLVKKNKNTIIAETKCYLHTPWSLKTNPCRRKRKIRRRRMKTTSSAKRVTQVRSAGGYKASTVIWEVNFNQIFPEFGPNTSFIEFSNLISQLRILEHAKLFNRVRVSPFTSCAPSETLPVVCACVVAHVFSARDVCLL